MYLETKSAGGPEEEVPGGQGESAQLSSFSTWLPGRDNYYSLLTMVATQEILASQTKLDNFEEKMEI